MTTPGSSPPAADLRPLLLAVRDQGQRGTCVAFAVTGAHELARAAGAAATEGLSEEALYWACKVVDGNWASGTSFASVSVALDATGQPIEAVWPYDPNRADGVPYDPPTAPDAAWHKTGLAATTFDGDDMRQHLDRGHAVMLGVTVFDCLFVPTLEGRIEAPQPGSPPRGGHAVLAVGYDTSALLIRNSWGASWGLGGYGWLSNEYVDRHGRGAWRIDDAAVAGPTTGAGLGDVYGVA